MNPVLQYGSTGPEVAWLATQLAYMQYSPSMTDVYDWQTAEAVAELQRRYGYHPDGRMGPETWALLEAVMSGSTPPPPPSDFGTGVTGTPQGGTFSALPHNNTPGSTNLPGQLTAAQRDSKAILTARLKQYGLEQLVPWIERKLLDGASADEIGIELFDQSAFKERFPVIEARRVAGLTPVSVAEVLSYEDTARELYRRAGISNTTFTSSAEVQKLMALDVSTAELSDRITNGFMRVTQAPPEVRAAFGSFFGAEGDTALLSLFLNPDLAAPELEKKAMSAYVGGIGTRFGVSVAQTMARDIAETGVSEGQVWQAYRSLEALSPIFEESISENVDLSAGKEGVQAVFGTSPGAVTQIERRGLSRKSTFAGGGGAASDQQGVSGLGVADR